MVYAEDNILCRYTIITSMEDSENIGQKQQNEKREKVSVDIKSSIFKFS